MSGPKDSNEPNEPNDLSWNWQRQPQFRPFSTRFWAPGRLRVPPPPGPPPKQSKAEREAEARAEARAERMHLAGLSGAGVIIMFVIVAAVGALFLWVLITHV
jgi:hypothetical protein